MKSAFSNSQFASVASRSSIGRLIVAVVCSMIWPLDSLLFQVNILGPEFATDEANVAWCTNVHEQLKVSHELHEKTPLQMTVGMLLISSAMRRARVTATSVRNSTSNCIICTSIFSHKDFTISCIGSIGKPTVQCAKCRNSCYQKHIGS